jgi:acetylglutamate kinase
VIVLKIGGAAARSAGEQVRWLSLAGPVCVVHGAGPQITAEMERRGLEVRFVDGRRVTTRAGLDVVRESLAEVNAALCAEIGARAVGLMGDEVGLQAVPVPQLGLVGRPVPSRVLAIDRALSSGFVPVVAPLAAGPLNVNADDAAAALAVALCADRLLFVSDVPGVFHDGGVVPALAADAAEELLEDGAFEGGIVPKLYAAVKAARLGVPAQIGATAVVA